MNLDQKERLKGLRLQLPYHYAPIISDRSGLTPTQIRKVFQGDITNHKTIATVVEVACDLRDEILNKQEALKQRIQNIKSNTP